MGELVVATDGAALPTNPGPGGWGWVTDDNRSGSGSEPWTTNNRMELRAVLEALETLPDRPIRVLSDSDYVVRVFTEWLPRWRKSAKRRKNRDLIDAIAVHADRGDVSFEWVRGHAGHPLNELADALANRAAELQH